MTNYQIVDQEAYKIIEGHDFHCLFDKETGFTATWGKTKDEDPLFSPVGPLIADIEISTICGGPTGKSPCRACYKGNTPSSGGNMGLETFKKVLNKFNCNKQLHQVALGIGNIDANPDLYPIMEWTRSEGVIPNITVNGFGLTEFHVDRLSKLCGAIAVSNYGFELCFDSVKKLTNSGMKQVNIHQILSESTLEQCWDLLFKQKEDSRLEKLNAVVFLTLKPKGPRNTLRQLRAFNEYRMLIDHALDKHCRIGFDSCGANNFLKAISGRSEENRLVPMVEPCESDLFSTYCNYQGIHVPCSFCEGVEGIHSIDLTKIDDFMKEVWLAPETISWRERLLRNNRSCPVYDLSMT